MKTTKILLLTVILLAGCSKDENETENKKITVSDPAVLTQEAYADETALQKTVNFTTVAAWTSTVDTSDATQANGGVWVSISPDHGDVAGTYSIGISLAVNTTGKDRTATVCICCNGEELTITVAQKATAKDGKVPVDLYNDEGVVINGIRWATRNVDAPGTFAVTPESYGMFYQWNRKKGWSSTGIVSGWDYSSLPLGATWTESNDPCPKGWRVPIISELKSLVNSGSIWTIRNGVAGRLFETDNNCVFFPAAGCRSFYDGSLYIGGTDGQYWSSTEIDSYYAQYLKFNSGDVSAIYFYDDRRGGKSIRCVAN